MVREAGEVRGGKGTVEDTATHARQECVPGLQFYGSEFGEEVRLIRECPSSEPLSLAPASANSSKDTRLVFFFELFADTRC